MCATGTHTWWCVLRATAHLVALTVNSDTPTLVAHSDKGKPVESRGRKATGLRA